MQLGFKINIRWGNAFQFKDCIPKDLTAGAVYKFWYGLCNDISDVLVYHHVPKMKLKLKVAP